MATLFVTNQPDSSKYTIGPVGPAQPTQTIKPAAPAQLPSLNVTAGVQAPKDLSGRYADVNGTIWDKMTNKAFSTESQFFANSGLKNFQNVKFDTAWQPPLTGFAKAEAELRQPTAAPIQPPSLNMTNKTSTVAIQPKEKNIPIEDWMTPAQKKAAEVANFTNTSTGTLLKQKYGSNIWTNVGGFLLDLVDPVTKDLSTAKISSQIADDVANGKIDPKVYSMLQDLNKSGLQVLGDAAQVGLLVMPVMTVGAATVKGGQLIAEQGLKNALLELGKIGMKEGTLQGFGFGVAQALSSGSKDPAELAKIILTTTAGGAVLGGVIHPLLPLAGVGLKKTAQTLGKVVAEVQIIRNQMVERLVAEGWDRKAALEFANQGGFAKVPGLKGKAEPLAQEAKAKLPALTKTDNLAIKLRNALSPIKGTDTKTQGIYKTWIEAKATAKELAQAEASAMKGIPEKQGLETILKYEKGAPTPYSGQIGNTFDALRAEAQAKGLKVPFRQNYVPQMYKNSSDEVAVAVTKYMKDKGVNPEIINAYINGKQLPEEISKALKLDPSFTKQRVFPDYATAMKYGLTPKYTHPAQLAAAYRQSMEDALANQKLISDLVQADKLLPAKGPGKTIVDIPGLTKAMYADPKLSSALNGIYRNEQNLTFGQAILKKTAGTSRFMQELALSAGFPGTDINFFSIGIGLIKQLTGRVGEAVLGHPFSALTGVGKDIAAFVRSNFNGATVRFFENKAATIQKMAKEGIDISDRVGNWRDMYKNMAAKTEWSKVIGRKWDEWFQKKTFAALMPMNYVNTFEGAYKGALKKGLSETESTRLAADVTRKLHGLIEDTARSRNTKDALSSVFFAPKFREGIINTLWNTGKSLTTELRNPAFAKNRQLAAGIVVTYGMYQALNYKLNNQYTWQNEPGHENDLRIPLPNGNVLYTSFMPSFASMPRNLFGIGVALYQGDLKTATQKTSSFFSMPVQTTTQILNNRDYFGNAIYKDTDTWKEKMIKVGEYLGLQANHPYLKLIGNYIANQQEPDKAFQKPLVQSLIEASEFPVKFETMDRLSRAQFYNAIDKKTVQNAADKKRIQPTYNEVQKLLDQGNYDQAQNIVDGLSDADYDTYKSIKASGARSDTIGMESVLYKTYQRVQSLKNSGNQAEAQRIVDGLTDDEYHAYTLLKNRFTQ